MEDLSTRIRELIEPLLKEQGIDLVDLHVRRRNRNITIEILADKPTGGITIGECSGLNRQIGEIFDRENLVGQRYLLDVSSPGVERPLRTAKDFLRVVSRKVRVFLTEPLEGKIEYVGVILGVDEANILLDGGAGTLTLPLSIINFGKQIIDFKEG